MPLLKYVNTLCSHIDGLVVLEGAIPVFRTRTAKFTVDEGAVYELAVYPVRMICIRIHEHAVLKPAIHHDITVIVVLVFVIRIRWLTIYTETEELHIFESTVHHTAVFSNHTFKLHIDDIEIDKIELSDFCHSDIGFCIFHDITSVKRIIHIPADPLMRPAYSVLFSVGISIIVKHMCVILLTVNVAVDEFLVHHFKFLFIHTNTLLHWS